jgi:hypothetical protein
MPKSSSPRRLGAIVAHTGPAVGASSIAGGAAWAGRPVAGVVIAAVIMATQLVAEVPRALTALTQRRAALAVTETQHQVALAATEIALKNDSDNAVKRIGALTELIDKLR